MPWDCGWKDEHLFDLLKITGREFNVGTDEIFLQTMEFGGSGDGYDPWLLREEPLSISANS
jgi:imidazole glycerol phosphate synthase subunit HisF